MHLHIYIYIYICVCCLCTPVRRRIRISHSDMLGVLVLRALGLIGPPKLSTCQTHSSWGSHSGLVPVTALLYGKFLLRDAQFLLACQVCGAQSIGARSHLTDAASREGWDLWNAEKGGLCQDVDEVDARRFGRGRSWRLSAGFATTAEIGVLSFFIFAG